MDASNQLPEVHVTESSVNHSYAQPMYPNLQPWIMPSHPIDLSVHDAPLRITPPSRTAYTRYVSNLQRGTSSMHAVPSVGTNCSPSSTPSPPPITTYWPFMSPFQTTTPLMSADNLRHYRAHAQGYHPYFQAHYPYAFNNAYNGQLNHSALPTTQQLPLQPLPLRPIATTTLAAAAVSQPSTNSTTTSPLSSSSTTTSTSQERPFKTLAKDPLSLMNSSAFLDEETRKEFIAFREKYLSQIKKGGDNSKMSRTNNQSNISDDNNNSEKNQSSVVSSHSTEDKDASYLEKRKKNNEAAKKSRDARKQREDELALYAEFIKVINIRLTQRVTFLESIINQMQAVQSQQFTQLVNTRPTESPDQSSPL